MICGICLDLINESANGSCNHHFCYKCLLNWLKNKNKCPKCNNNIYEINFDKEYDDLLNEYKKTNSKILINNINEERIECIEKKIVIDFNNYKNEDIGITITNNSNGPGVKIEKILYGKVAYKHHLKKGDIIIFINKIPCINHKQSIEILENLCLSYKLVEIILLY